MLRLSLCALALVALSLPASTAPAASYTDAVTSFAGYVELYVSDGLETVRDQSMAPGIDLTDQAYTGNTLIEETGTIGVINPLRVFAGQSNATIADLEWDGYSGIVTGKTAQVVFETFEIALASDQIAMIRTSGLEYYVTTPVATLTAAGSVLFDGASYPFTFSQSGIDTSTRTTGNPDAIEWFVSFNAPELFRFDHGGLSYRGRLLISNQTVIPEPGTAALLGIGLAVLAAGAQARPRSAVRSSSRGPGETR